MPRTGMTPEEIKTKAIKIAKDQMRRHGYEKLRFSDVAKELGISHVALYAHFADKAALLDGVSQKWVLDMDAALEKVCLKKEPVLERIQEWFLVLHKFKRDKVLEDPELFKAFEISSEKSKPFVIVHLKTLETQLIGLIKEAIAEKKIKKDSPEKIHALLLEMMVGFYHPRIIVEHLNEKREPLLKRSLEIVLSGLA